jgi:hypothetical protein
MRSKNPESPRSVNVREAHEKLEPEISKIRECEGSHEKQDPESPRSGNVRGSHEKQRPGISKILEYEGIP